MTVDPGSGLHRPRRAVDWTTFTDSHDIPEWVSTAYADSYQGPHDDEAETGSAATPGPIFAPALTPALLSAHYRLGLHRPAGESRVAVYPPDDPGGFGPALQVVTDDGAMLIDSITVLLHRLGVAYAAIMNPVFHVRRDDAGELLTIEPEPVRRRRDRRDLDPRTAFAVGGPQRFTRSRTLDAGCAR